MFYFDLGNLVYEVFHERLVNNGESWENIVTYEAILFAQLSCHVMTAFESDISNSNEFSSF